MGHRSIICRSKKLPLSVAKRPKEAQEFLEPGEDTTEVVADGGEDDVGGVSGAAFEIAPSEVAFGLQVPDDGFDGGSASQLAFDDAEDSAFLA